MIHFLFQEQYSIDGKDIDLNELEKQFGIVHGNKPPVNFHEITEEEFAKSEFFHYTPIATGYSQVFLKPDGDLRNDKIMPMRFFFMHDNTGFAMYANYWQGHLHYFAFGCDHEFRELSQDQCFARDITHFGRCYHVYECLKCDYIDAVDSSD